MASVTFNFAGKRALVTGAARGESKQKQSTLHTTQCTIHNKQYATQSVKYTQYTIYNTQYIIVHSALASDSLSWLNVSEFGIWL